MEIFNTREFFGANFKKIDSSHQRLSISNNLTQNSSIIDWYIVGMCSRTFVLGLVFLVFVQPCHSLAPSRRLFHISDSILDQTAAFSYCTSLGLQPVSVQTATEQGQLESIVKVSPAPLCCH